MNVNDLRSSPKEYRKTEKYIKRIYSHYFCMPNHREQTYVPVDGRNLVIDKKYFILRQNLFILVSYKIHLSYSGSDV